MLGETVYLKFADEQEWREAAKAAGVLSTIQDEDGKDMEAWSCYTPDWAIDVVGTIYDPGTYDADGKELTPPVAHEGYHVNVKWSDALPATFSTRSVAPATPRRVFYGDA